MAEDNKISKEKIVDRQILNLPKEVKFCTRCVMSNQRPRITFDENGVCSACRYAEYKKNKIDWKKREQELRALCDKHRSKDGSFDVIVPCSGGKDSSMIAHRLKVEYGMHPLCVTFSPPQYTDIGWRNLRRFIESGFHHYLVSPAGDVYRTLGRLCFELYGDHNEIFDRGQMSAPFRAAVEHNVSLVMYGENGEAEYGGTSDYNESPGLPWEAFEKVYYSEDLDEIGHLAKELGYLPNLRPHDLDIFRLPHIEKLKALNIQMHWFAYYHFWQPQEHYYYASKYTGFQANPEGRLEGTYSDYAQLDDLTDSFLYYMMFIKYGFGRATSDAAHEIREGRITREEGVALVRRFDGEFPAKTYKIFLDHLGINDEQFQAVVDKYRLPHIWKKEDGKWKLRKQVE
jgi:N-acetyl sugar amidotransferase